MSNIKKGEKLTVSTGNGISRHTTENLGVLEVSGPAMSDTTTDYTTNTAQLTIGATDVSGVLKLGINNDGNTFIDAIRGGNHTDIIMQKYGGDVIIGSGASSIAKVGIRTNAPDSTFHINSTDGLIIPVGTNGERPNPAYNGMIRYNTTTSQFEGYGPGSAWGSLGGVKDVDGDTYILAESSAGADNDDLQFFTAGQERMSINSVGDISMNGDITTDTGYPYYQSLGTEKIVNPPSTTRTVHGVNITAMNKRTRASYASAEACVSTWTARSSATEGNSWCSVCWSPELSIFVAVAYAGTNRVMTSPDGITWTARSSASEANDWNSVCWSPELSIFVAVAYGGTNRVMTSPDGITWTARSSASEANTWVSVCWSPELSIFVAVANSGTNRVMTSPDGITWTARSSASEANGWISVCWSPELSIFVAVAYSGTNRVMTSPDGITWTARSSATEANSWQSVCWSPELSIFVAVAVGGTNRVMTSPDGITWTARSSASDANGWRAVCWSPELSIFVAVAYNGTNRVMTSPDGITWTARSSATEANSWYSVCWSPELSIFVAVVPGGTNRVMTSNIGMPNSKSVVKALPTQMSVLPNGNVGIGTFAEEKLVVDGNMRLLGDLNVGLVDADDTHAGTLSAGYDFGSQTKILASDAAASDNFGHSVAISGNYAIVGAYGNDDVPYDSGSAYIFNVSTGTQLHKLVASDAAAYDNFGSSVAISGNYAIVGAPTNDDGGADSGSAYIFNVSTGTQLHKLVASDAAAYDHFGSSVAISGNYAIVGGRYNDDVPSDSGSAYIFNVSTGTQLHKLVASDAAGVDYFGHSVAISGNYAIVGAYGNDDVPSDSGSAYIFNVSTGTQLHKLLAIDAAAVDNFGSIVAISGNYAIVGANGNDDGGINSGSAYIFNVSTGTQLHKLVASDAAASDQFGISVAISGNYAIVGALYNDDGGTNSGSAYIFNVSTGTQLHKLVASDAAASDIFGHSVAISGNYAIVGANGNDDGGTDSGSAYIFAPSFHVTESGNVGIGTASPYAKLIVQGTSEPTTGYGYTNTPANMAWPIVVNNVSAAFGTPSNSGYGCGIKFKQYFDNINDQRWSGIAGVSQGQFSDYTGLAFYTCNYYVTTEKMRILHNGNVGIGTPTPDCPLHVATTDTVYVPAGRAYFYNYEQANEAVNRALAIHAEGIIWSSNLGFIATNSDRRIKKNIVDVPDNLALEMVRNIPCRYYEYKDTLYAGTDKTIGFIAQEVKEILPMAISIQTSIIPNEMRKLENVSWEQIENTYKLITDLADVSGVKYRFYVSNDVSGNEERKEIIGNSDNTFTFDSSYNNVFIYGKEVNDFHTLDKQKIFTLHHSAIQEIDRIQQQHIIDISNAQATIQTLQTDLSTANTTIQTLQTDLSTANTTIQQQDTTIQQHETTIQQQQQQIADILSRLESLESSA